jgi:hypothetical protein
MFKIESQTRVGYLDLSIEALWVARVIQDGMDILLACPTVGVRPDAKQTKLLGKSRDVFERLGFYGCSASRVYPVSTEWSAVSRTELIRQVAVHWRYFIDASFGMACASDLICSLSDYDISILEQVLRFERDLKVKTEEVVFCMQQELDASVRRQDVLRAKRYKTYMAPVRLLVACDGFSQYPHTS